MLRGLVLRFLFGVAGLWIAAQIVPGISYRNLGSLLAAAAILGVINAFTLKLVTLFLHGFHVRGFWPAFLGALIVSIAAWIGQALVEPRRRK